jgi:hypothetical protein
MQELDGFLDYLLSPKGIKIQKKLKQDWAGA